MFLSYYLNWYYVSNIVLSFATLSLPLNDMLIFMLQSSAPTTLSKTNSRSS